jgi:hypothetical protein
MVEDEAERSGLAAAQRARHRIGPGVAELAGGDQHALAQRGAQLVGPVVGVGDRRARDAEVLGDIGEGGSVCGAGCHLNRSRLYRSSLDRSSGNLLLLFGV